jgi:4-amino-4-deoxychorismate lyase
MSEWYLHGARVDSVPVDDRSVQYGDGLFETVAIRDAQPRFWDLHLERLTTGCDRLGICAPKQRALRADLAAGLAATAIDTEWATAKIVVSSGTGPRGYKRPDNASPTVRIGLFGGLRLTPETYRDGARALVCQTRLAQQPLLAGIKSLNRLEQVLARAEWDDAQILEGLMLDTGDRLICGTMSNVFIVRNNVIATPAITRCGVAGVMRRHVLAQLAREGVACDVRDIHVDELDDSDEIFLTNSQFGVLPVRQLAARQLAVRSISRRVMNLVAASGVPECAT